MILIRNRMYQPLTLNLKNGKSLHLGIRDKVAICEDDISIEIKGGALKGLIEIIPIKVVETVVASVHESSVNESSSSTKRRK